MAKRTVTTKSQIPDYIKKRITNFKNITTNKAIFEYEKFLLIRRAKGDYKEFLKGYYQTPERVSKKDIQELREMRGKKLEQERVKYEQEVEINRRILRKQMEDENWGKSSPTIGVEIEPPELPTPEPITVPDLPDIPIEPEPIPPVYTDPTTAEAIFEEDIPDYMERVKEFIDDIIEKAYQSGDQAIVSHSSYRSGRTKTSRSRAWVESNIDKAVNKVVDKLNQIKTDEALLMGFAKRCNDQSYLGKLQDAIGAYIAEAYSDTTGQSFYISKAYELLSITPISFNDTVDIESYDDYEEYDE